MNRLPNDSRENLTGKSLKGEFQKLVQNFSTEITTQCVSIFKSMEEQVSNILSSKQDEYSRLDNKYKEREEGLRQQISELRSQNENHSTYVLMNQQKIKSLMNENQLLQFQLIECRKKLERLMNPISISNISSILSNSNQSSVNSSVSNQLISHERSNDNQDEFDIIKEIGNMKKIKKEADLNINEFEWNPEEMFCQGLKKAKYDAKITSQGILFTNINQDMSWNKFIIYKSLLTKIEKKFTFKVHKLQSKNFSIGICQKSQLNRKVDDTKNVLAYQPYSGKFSQSKNRSRALDETTENLCEVIINIVKKKIRWQKDDGSILFESAIPETMLANDPVVYFELANPGDEVEMFLR